MSSVELREVVFDIPEKSQEKEWSGHQDVQMYGKIDKDADDNPIVDVMLKSFNLQFDREHFVEQQYVELDIERKGHQACRVDAKAWLRTINPTGNRDIKFSGRIVAVVIAQVS